MTTVTPEPIIIEFAVASPETFTVAFLIELELSAGSDPIAYCESEQFKIDVANALSTDDFQVLPDSITCLGWIPSEARRLGADVEPAAGSAPAEERLLTEGTQRGSFEIQLAATSEELAATYVFLAQNLNTTQLKIDMESTEFIGEVIGDISVSNVMTERDEQPWTTRGTANIKYSTNYDLNQVGNFLIDMFVHALSNVSLGDEDNDGLPDGYFSVGPTNCTIFKTTFNETLASDGQYELSVLFFINRYSAEEDLQVLNSLGASTILETLQASLDALGIDMTMVEFEVVYDVFGKINITSSAPLESDQRKLTDPFTWVIEDMKISMRDSAAAQYELTNEEIGMSLLNIIPFVSGDNETNIIELAYLFNPDTFDDYCNIAADQESTEGIARLELSLDYPANGYGGDPTVMPKIRDFYQDPTLSCSGSVAEPYDPTDVQAAAYAILFGIGLFVFICIIIFIIYARSAIYGYWAENGVMGVGKAMSDGPKDNEAPMEEASMNEHHGHHVIHAVRATSIQINLPPVEPGSNQEVARDDMLLVSLDAGNDEPEIERGGDLDELEDLQELVDYEDDEGPTI